MSETFGDLIAKASREDDEESVVSARQATELAEAAHAAGLKSEGFNTWSIGSKTVSLGVRGFEVYDYSTDQKTAFDVAIEAVRFVRTVHVSKTASCPACGEVYLVCLCETTKWK